MAQAIVQIYKSVFVIMFVIAYGVGCSNPSSSYENKFYFYDDNAQKEFIEKLEKQNIQYRVDRDGAIWYHVEDSGKVGKIKKEILAEHYIDPYSVSYTREREKERFLSELKKHGIKYEIKKQSGREWISWSKEDDDEVRKIRVEVRSKINENNS